MSGNIIWASGVVRVLVVKCPKGSDGKNSFDFSVYSEDLGTLTSRIFCPIEWGYERVAKEILQWLEIAADELEGGEIREENHWSQEQLAGLVNLLDYDEAKEEYRLCLVS